MATADAIVQTLVASHDRGVQVLRALGDGRLTLEVGEYRQQPDFHVQLSFAGHAFNVVFGKLLKPNMASLRSSWMSRRAGCITSFPRRCLRLSGRCSLKKNSTRVRCIR